MTFTAAGSDFDQARIGRVFRAESGRTVATLIRVFGDIDLAEDTVHAFLVALQKWTSAGIPPNPGGWITTTAHRRAIDRLRREKRGRELLQQIGAEPFVADSLGSEGPTPQDADAVQEDRLRLIFTCCHPALATDAQVALPLRLLGGMTTRDVAAAFLVSESTIAQRLVRAKRKIKAAHIPYRVPSQHELAGRIPPVLAVIYLIYNAGADAPADCGLRAEAIRLARAVAELLPDEPEAAGLLALLLLTESRRCARVRPDGSLVTLDEQDRTRWDHHFIQEGQDAVIGCVRRNRPGIYQIQAAINAVHVDAASIEQTDWRQIVALYDQLLALAPTAVVALNRAIAVGVVEGPATALGLVDALELDQYQPLQAARADLLRRLGRTDEATREYRRAAEMTPPGPQRDYLRRGGRGGR